MSVVRTLLSAGLLLLAAVTIAPAATAALDNVWVCVGYKEGMCANNDVVEVNAKNHFVGVCVIGVAGSCDPYEGDLVRADVDGQDVIVPDPCYTTSCF